MVKLFTRYFRWIEFQDLQQTQCSSALANKITTTTEKKLTNRKKEKEEEEEKEDFI